jgi:hypothetical protein
VRLSFENFLTRHIELGAKHGEVMDLFALLGGDGDSDDEYFRQRILNRKTKKPKHGGSAPGRGANKDRGREDAGKRLFSDYLSPNSTYNDSTWLCWSVFRG